MRNDDPCVLAIVAAIVGLVDALAAERQERARDGLVPLADAGIERRALRRLVREGRVRATRIGRRVYIFRADLASLLDAPPQARAASTATDAREAARAAYRAKATSSKASSAGVRLVSRGGR
jgi:hypothetical protein